MYVLCSYLALTGYEAGDNSDQHAQQTADQRIQLIGDRVYVMLQDTAAKIKHMLSHRIQYTYIDFASHLHVVFLLIERMTGRIDEVRAHTNHSLLC